MIHTPVKYVVSLSIYENSYCSVILFKMCTKILNWNLVSFIQPYCCLKLEKRKYNCIIDKAVVSMQINVIL